MPELRFKIDENLPEDVAELLRDSGHDAETVRSEHLTGCNDQLLERHARFKGRVLVTLDLDFADTRLPPPGRSPGIIVLRLGSQSRRHVLQIMNTVIGLLTVEPIEGQLWIVRETGLRSQPIDIAGSE